MTTQRPWEATVFSGLSVDGFIARLDHDITWLEEHPPASHAPGIPNPQVPDFEGLMETCDHMVMGRATFQKVLDMGFWPYGPLQVIVLSSTLTGPQPHGALVATDLPHVLALLAERDARQVYVDGGRTVQTFLAAGLVDHIVVNYLPVLIGTGIRLFGALPHDLHLMHRATSTTDSGVVSSAYQVLHSATEAPAGNPTLT